MDHHLACQRCGERFDPGDYPVGCPACRDAGEAGRLEVVLEPDAIPRLTSDPDEPSMWRYRELLPLLADEPVTLGEGLTHLVDVPADRIGTDRIDVRLKNETGNPSWSYKDRLNAMLISNATHHGHAHFVTSSTGNHGASTAAYATRAGAEETLVFLHPEADRPHRVQLQAYGAAVAVLGESARQSLLRAFVDRGWYPTVNVPDEYVGLPYAAEGYKTIAFELVEQLGGPPDVVVCPIGAGDGLYGTWKGFRELVGFDLIDDPPRMVGVQPAERPSVVRAIGRDLDRVEPTPGPMPIATSTSGPTAGEHAMRAIGESDGLALAIERAAVRDGIEAAGRLGVFLEPASAMTVAAVEQLLKRGAVDTGETVVCLGTGAGPKWPAKVADLIGEPQTVEPSVDAIAATLGIDPMAPSTSFSSSTGG